MVRFEDQGFPSIRQLLDYHVQNRVHVTKKSRAVLVHAVGKPVKDKWEMNRDDIVLQEKKLGSGHFGDVMKGCFKPANVPVAVKSCRECVSATVKQKFLAEAEILKQYDHPNIVRLIGVCADKEPVLIGECCQYFHINVVGAVVELENFFRVMRVVQNPEFTTSSQMKKTARADQVSTRSRIELPCSSALYKLKIEIFEKITFPSLSVLRGLDHRWPKL